MSLDIRDDRRHSETDLHTRSGLILPNFGERSPHVCKSEIEMLLVYFRDLARNATDDSLIFRGAADNGATWVNVKDDE